MIQQQYQAHDCKKMFPYSSRLQKQALTAIKQQGLYIMTISIVTSVGATGFEPATPCSQSRCATELRHAPNNCNS